MAGIDGPGVKPILTLLSNILFISCSYRAMRLVPPKVPSPQLNLSLPSLLASWITVESAGDHWDCAALTESSDNENRMNTTKQSANDFLIESPVSSCHFERKARNLSQR